MTVGETLSRARRKRKLSVEDVAAATRIRATLIESIEAGRFESCGGAVYARGHIRSIARVIGIDAAPLIEEFDASHQVDGPVVADAAAAADHTTDLSVVARSEHRKPNWSIAAAAALILIIVLAVGGLLRGGSKPSSAQTGDPKTPNIQQTAPVSGGNPKTSQTPPAPSSNVSASRATMLVRAKGDRTWLEVSTKSGQKLFSGMLEPGQQKSFSARHGLAYVIGNAPAVDVVVNGNDIGSPPSPSVVARGSVVPGKGTLHQT